MFPSFLQLLFLVICLFVLGLVNHQILLQIIHIMLRTTGSANAAVGVYFLLVYPGIFVHESAHWLVAFVLGLRPSAFNVWPELNGQYLRLGYVRMQRSDLFSESLVGAAPLLAGLILITFISQQVFQINSIVDSFALGDWGNSLARLNQSLFRIDRLFWLYFLFALANGMMLSSSDQEPIRPILGFFLFALVTFAFVGMPLDPLTSLFGALFPALEASVISLLLILSIDVFVLVTLGILSILMVPLR